MNLFKKYFFTAVVIILVSFSFLIGILSVSVNNFLAKDKRSTLLETGKTISRLADGFWEPDKVLRLKEIVSVVSHSTDSNILVTNMDGQPYICSCIDFETTGICEHINFVIPKEIMEQALADEYYEVGTLNNLFSGRSYICGQPIYKADGTVVGTVFAASPASSINAFFNQFVKLILFSTMIPVVLMFFSVYAMTFKMTKPLRLMSEAARSMAKGDFSKRIPVESDDEIGELSIAFNQMTNSLVQLESMRRSFIANVSHELKTPMTTIGGFIDGILDGTIPPEKHSHYLGVASIEVKRLSRLVTAMLSLSKLESGEMRINRTQFDLSVVACTTVISFEQRIDLKQIRIEGLEALPETIINADQDLIHQVVYNLVDNAVKFTNENGYIAIKLDYLEDERILLTIRNSGEGIGAKELPRVFERFYKTDKSRSADKSGTGLGLYLVKTIIDIHAGSITVRSVQGEYTDFEVCLPIDTTPGGNKKLSGKSSKAYKKASKAVGKQLNDAAASKEIESNDLKSDQEA